MKIILSQFCKSFTGQINRQYGYAVRKTKKGFFLFKCSKNKVQLLPDGHLRAIFALAQMARQGLFLADVQVTASELFEALKEAHHWTAAWQVYNNDINYVQRTYSARDIINLETTFGL